jgi:hydrogenase maturation protease
MPGRTLVACLGNIFLGDDGFGVEVARRLARENLPEGTRVTDYGIRGMHLAYDLAEGWDATILVDAAPRGGKPGTIYVIEPVSEQPTDGDGAPLSLTESMLFDPHGMQPDVLLGMTGMLGAEAGRVLVVGCEPVSVAEGIGLSEPVAAAVDEAARVVLDLVRGGPAGLTRPGGPSASSGGASANSGSSANSGGRSADSGGPSADSGRAATKE